MKDPRYRTQRWRNLTTQVIRRDGRVCSVSGCRSDMTAKGMTFVDHIIEVEDGGPFWDPSNLQILCKPHHDEKSATVRATRKTGANSQPSSPNA